VSAPHYVRFVHLGWRPGAADPVLAVEELRERYRQVELRRGLSSSRPHAVGPNEVMPFLVGCLVPAGRLAEIYAVLASAQDVKAAAWILGLAWDTHGSAAVLELEYPVRLEAAVVDCIVAFYTHGPAAVVYGPERVLAVPHPCPAEFWGAADAAQSLRLLG
jgi:hypothetical protein